MGFNTLRSQAWQNLFFDSVSRKTYYKWNKRYKQKGIEGLSDSSRPHNIKYKKITSEIEETILDLRLTRRFGCSRIKFRLRKFIGISLSTRTIYKILKRHGLNILKCKAKKNLQTVCNEASK